MRERSGKWRSLGLLCLAEVLVLTLWFSATAVIPVLRRTTEIPDSTAALYASAVGAGFVVGTLLSAILALADRIEPRRLFAVAALVAAGANALILAVDPTGAIVILLRFITGSCMAGIYPVGMKIAATWAKGDMGVMTGVLTGALTLGTAAPHLFNAFGGLEWRLTIGMTSLLAVAAAVLVTFVKLGPGYAALRPGVRPAVFRPEIAVRAWKDKAVRLANFGYFGHMWELYVMWAWVGLFLHESFRASGMAPTAAIQWSSIGAFALIAAGGIGCFSGGFIADRIGRTAFTAIMMAVSGLCTLTIGLLFGLSPLWIILPGLIWGYAIAADSPQFSGSIMELSPPEQTGTIVTIQICIGFSLTPIAIHLLPGLVDRIGWQFTYMPFAVGPLLGIWAMLRLRRMPEARKIAGGRR